MNLRLLPSIAVLGAGCFTLSASEPTLAAIPPAAPELSSNAVVSAAVSVGPASADTNPAPTNVTGETNPPPVRLEGLDSPAAARPEVAPERAPAPFSMEAFKLIAERNIFNPNRGPRRESSRNAEVRRPVRVEAFGLLGTMSYEKGSFAIFDGSSSEFRKVAEPSQTIAGYRIAEITGSHVVLESTNGTRVELLVGTQMRRQEDEEWQLNAAGGAFNASSSRESGAGGASASTATGQSNSEPANASSGGGTISEEEALKRLMQKREEEFKNEK